MQTKIGIIVGVIVIAIGALILEQHYDGKYTEKEVLEVIDEHVSNEDPYHNLRVTIATLRMVRDINWNDMPDDYKSCMYDFNLAVIKNSNLSAQNVVEANDYCIQ